MLVFFVLSGCARQKVYKKYPDCTDYFNFLEKSWSKKDNSFFVVKEIPDSTNPVWAKYVEPPQFQRQWDKNVQHCLCNLTKKEVEAIFGKPTIIGKTFQHIKKVHTETYGYHIADKFCDEDSQMKTRVNICSFIAFTFWEGKQDRRFTSRPRLRLKNPHQ